jgi:predicted metal-dependent phosphoesterase TrpH
MNQLYLVCLFSLIPALGFSAKWYKGNTHVHTTLCGHADSTPEFVAQWYHDRGYNFLVLSEHNKFIDPSTVKLKGEVRDDFLLLPGEEVTGPVHSTAMNISRLVPWDFKHKDRTKIIQNHVDETRKAGGAVILNHPNFGRPIHSHEILPVKNLYMFELYNAHPGVHSFGNAHRPNLEQVWDALLEKKMTIYGVSSDDAHKLQKWGEKENNPGRGWVMVRSDDLSSEAITKSMLRGDFYSSSGVMLDNLVLGDSHIEISVNQDETACELASEFLFGRPVKKGEPGTTIEFIGPGGEIVKTVEGFSANCNAESVYLRAKVTHRVKKEDGSLREYYAWTQPVFTDGR